MSVSRETPPPPPSAAGVFHDQLPLMTQYAAILANEGVERGMIGPREVPRLWDRHLVNSGVVVPRLPAGATVADVGSGAGLPGLVWAIARPEVVTARAVAALEKLAKWCMPLVAPGGVLLALKGQSAADEVKDAKRTLGRLGATATLIRTYGDVEIPTTVVEVSK